MNFKAREMVMQRNGYAPLLTNGSKTFHYRNANIGHPVLFGVYKNEYLETSG